MSDYKIERDSMGEVRVPKGALYGAQTQRAHDNFAISGPAFPRVFIRALGLIKGNAAEANFSLGQLDRFIADAIISASVEVRDGRLDEHFPLVIYQTGSGTSTNMNVNEVIANRACEILGTQGTVHPNDHVNMGQSSNDVIPTAIHIAACLKSKEDLMPSLKGLKDTLILRANELMHAVKTGRTHLMDAMPVTFGQELHGWAYQISQSIERIERALEGVSLLALGGTAVGTGINASPKFAEITIRKISADTGISFSEAENHFAAQSAMDAAVELSSALKTTATVLMKIANDLRWMSSGPIAGLGEITLPALQPGSSIMPGKTNPVICEAVMMASAQVIGNDLAVAIANQSGNFQLNTMLPLIAFNLIESISLIGDAASVFAKKAISGFTVNFVKTSELLGRNPILITALAPVVGYDKAAEIAKKAYAEQRPIKDVAREATGMPEEELNRLLDPSRLAMPEQKLSDEDCA